MTVGPNGSRNACTCTHCDGFRDVDHYAGCSGYHCKGTCEWLSRAASTRKAC